MSAPKTYTLQQVLGSIRTALEMHFRGQYWVMAEMNRLNYYPHSGHCYPELVEKSGERVVAQARSIIWKNDFDRINSRFLEILKEPLKDGIKILFLCKVTFDPVYGLSLRILDIDPSYTLGDLEREKADSIRQLQSEGIFENNMALPLAIVPSRIAVISVESSKGYADFNRILDNNPSGYKVRRTLFPAILQGDAAVHSILFQLKQVVKHKENFDAVAIIRGGGGDIGLSCYNNLLLSRIVATYPLPVLTGIGHATNETVVELVAHTNCITPTKVAEFILEKFRAFDDQVNELSYSLADLMKRRFREENQFINTEQKMTMLYASSILQNAGNALSRLRSEIFHASNYSIAGSKNSFRQLQGSLARLPQTQLMMHRKEVNLVKDKVSTLAKVILQQQGRILMEEQRTVSNLHPGKVLQRGYAVLLKEGNIITSTSGIKTGDSIITVMNDGAFHSEITSFIDKPGIFKQD